jgi:hypothetical protein
MITGGVTVPIALHIGLNLIMPSPPAPWAPPPKGLQQLLISGLPPCRSVTLTYPLTPSARPPPPPLTTEPGACLPGQLCPPTKVLADAGLADPSALMQGGRGGGGTSGAPAAADGDLAPGGGPQDARAAVTGKEAGAKAPAATASSEIEPEGLSSREGARADGGAGVSGGGGGGGGGSGGSGAAWEVAAAAGVQEETADAREGLGRVRGDLLALVVGQSRQMGCMINVSCGGKLGGEGAAFLVHLQGTRLCGSGPAWQGHALAQGCTPPLGAALRATPWPPPSRRPGPTAGLPPRPSGRRLARLHRRLWGPIRAGGAGRARARFRRALRRALRRTSARAAAGGWRRWMEASGHHQVLLLPASPCPCPP